MNAMKTQTAHLRLCLLAAAITLTGLTACGKKHEPTQVNPEFSRYISGYTSGQISVREAIQIELASEPPQAETGAEITGQLFTLTPAAKGKTHWAGGRVIEFRPDEPLKEGTAYKAAFDLYKILPKVEKDFRTFAFDVYTVEQDFAIGEFFYQPVAANQNRWNTVTVEFSAADALTDSEAQSVFRAVLDGKTLPARLINSSDNGHNFRFVIDSVERASADRNLKMICDGKAVGSSKVVEKEAVIHALDAETFKVAGVQNCEPPERCVRVVFTDALGSQDLKGLIELENFTDYTLKTERNTVTIFPEANFPEAISGRIDKNIKNFAGKRMAEDYTINLTRKPDKPVVRIMNNGTILPDSKNLMFAFSAINLRAVEMRIIKIYERNILSFLQENPMNGSSELKRSGRLTAKKLLRLDQDKTKNLREWNNYAVDVSALVKQEPGAIYRVELIIRQEFSVYPCDGGQENSRAAALNENNFILTEDDLAVWDSQNGYYSVYEYDWEKYEWRERNNPCHPSFYMESDNIVARGSLFASNVGIVAKKGEGTEMFVTVQDIRTTEPLSGATVKALNYQLAPIATGTADANGFCALQVRRGEAFIIEAAHGGQKGYLKVNDGGELSLSRFDVGGKAVRRGLKGFIYGERGVWRPGDEIFMTFILEDRQKTIPAGHPVTAEIYNPQGQFYRKLTQTNPVGNFYSFAFKTEEQSPTGLWRAVISVGGAKFERGLRIETIKPNRLKINVDFGTELIETRNLKIALNAQWLHGATAKNLKTKMLLKLNPAPAAFKGYELYKFNNPAAEAYSYEEDIHSGQLDDEGNSEFTVSMPAAQAAAGMLRATFTTTVEESGGGESITINTLPYSPFPAYAGLNVHKASEHEILATDTVHYFDIALLDAKGKPLPSGELVYKAYRLKWSWWWDDERSGNNLSEVVSSNSIKPVIEQKVSVMNGKARIAFKAASKDWGRYLIYIKDPKGGHATGEQIFVDDPYWGGRSRQGDPQGLAMLTFAADKQTYNVGEDVNITLSKGGKGRALVSLENGTRSLRQWWVETKDGEPTTVKFSVTKDLAPNFYVHITLLQHHDQTLNDMPIRMYGVASITVTDPLGELKPVLDLPDVLRSEQEFTVSVKEANKQGMTYTLAIVDEGLLDINNFKTPDPYAEFNVKEALGVKTYDLYNDVIGAFAGNLKPLFKVGGGEDLNQGAERKQRFKPVVMFLGPFELKAGATDRHKVQLPPYNGSVRVMAVAANSDCAYGRAEKAVPVRNPLMVMAVLPRVLGPGEEVMMPVNIFVTDRSVRNVKVDVKSGGPLELQGGSQNLSFKDVGDDMVFFKLKVKKQTGPAQITVTASSGGEVSTETINIEVRNPNPPLTVFNSYTVKPGETLDIDYRFDEDLPDSKVSMEYARIPSVNLGRSLQYLIGYPHGCAEQITSGAFPQLFLHNFTELSAERKREIQVNVNAALTKLYSMQTADGGISMWSGSSQSHDWITSYVGHFAAAAKERGYNVPQSFINNWKSFQKRRAALWNNGKHEDDLVQTYRLYSLAAMGSPDLASMNKLRERPALSQMGGWQLASAYALCGRKDAARQAASGRKTQVAVYSPFRSSSFGSSERDEAIILEASILLDDMDQALVIARRLSDYLNGGSYSTQTTAWALMAMARFADKSGKGDMSFTTSYLGKTNKIETAAPVYIEDLAQVKRSGSIRVTNSGSGNIYIGRTMTCTPLEDRSPAAGNNLEIRAEYADIDGKSFTAKQMDAARLQRGTDFFVKVSVTNASRASSSSYTNLALTHIIPSGWEIFNTRLSDDAAGEDTASGKSSGGITYQDIRDDRVLSYFSLPPGQTKSVKLRLQAAYPGRFFMPAVACQAMYDNTVYARTAGAWVEVVK